MYVKNTEELQNSDMESLNVENFLNSKLQDSSDCKLNLVDTNFIFQIMS